MNKAQAIQALVKGVLLTHRYMSDNEYVYQRGTKMFMEDGASIDVITFWADRDNEGWEEDWEVYQELISDEDGEREFMKAEGENRDLTEDERIIYNL